MPRRRPQRPTSCLSSERADGYAQTGKPVTKTVNPLQNGIFIPITVDPLRKREDRNRARPCLIRSPGALPLAAGVLVEEMLEELIAPLVDGRTTGKRGLLFGQRSSRF